MVLHARNGRRQIMVSYLFCDVPEIRRVVQKAFIEEITRINYEREMAKRNMTAKPVRGFFDAETSA